MAAPPGGRRPRTAHAGPPDRQLRTESRRCPPRLDRQTGRAEHPRQPLAATAGSQPGPPAAQAATGPKAEARHRRQRRRATAGNSGPAGSRPPAARPPRPGPATDENAPAQEKDRFPENRRRIQRRCNRPQPPEDAHGSLPATAGRRSAGSLPRSASSPQAGTSTCPCPRHAPDTDRATPGRHGASGGRARSRCSNTVQLTGSRLITNPPSAQPTANPARVPSDTRLQPGPPPPAPPHRRLQPELGRGPLTLPARPRPAPPPAHAPRPPAPA